MRNYLVLDKKNKKRAILVLRTILEKRLIKKPVYNGCIYRSREFIKHGKLDDDNWLLDIRLMWKFYKHWYTEIEINRCMGEA